MTDKEIEELSQHLVTIKVYGKSPVYRNKYGERIQDWDTYGKEHAHRVDFEDEDKLVFIGFGSDVERAWNAVDGFRSSGVEISKIEVL